jgi:cobalt-zinc-cadmium efflux system protein
MTVKGAYLEVWSDAIGAIGVILGAVLIRVTGATWIDPLVGIGIALWVLPRAWSLLRDTTQVLLEGVPSRLSLNEVRDALNDADGVCGVHDLHLWSLAGDDASLTAHIEVEAEAEAEQVRGRLTTLLADRFAVRHVTLQTEVGPCRQLGHVHP